MPTSEFIPASRRPPVNSDGAQGMRSTYPAAMRAAQFGANNLVSSQLAPHGGTSQHFGLVSLKKCVAVLT